MTIGNIDFGIESKHKEKIKKSGKLTLKLLYTNGTDELEIEIKETILNKEIEKLFKSQTHPSE